MDHEDAPECRTLGCGNLAVAGEPECDECLQEGMDEVGLMPDCDTDGHNDLRRLQ